MTSAADAVDAWLARLAALDDPAVFLAVADGGDLRTEAAEIDGRPAAEVPLRGLVFAVKDNIDVAGLPTTAACQPFSYAPEADAVVVARLRAAGAIPVAKTNLDQFATGLVGTRSPHGTPVNPIHPDLVPGGSSSGSAVAVARHLVDFALGTDTAGSGRVPAAMCGLVGLKPTLGRLPNTGVVPAVRSADCVSVFAFDVERAMVVADVAAGPDPGDALSRAAGTVETSPGPMRVGHLSDDDLRAAGAAATVVGAYRATIDALAAEPGIALVPVDPAPLFAAGDLLYGGPIVAERTAAVGQFIAANQTADPDSFDPTVAAIITAGADKAATAAYETGYALAALRAEAATLFSAVDAVVTPTIPRAVTRAEIAEDPVGPNTELGRFTTFANLLDLAAITVPAMPGGVTPDPARSLTIYAPAWGEPLLGRLGHVVTGAVEGTITIAVAGAHLRGQPLEHQLVGLGAIWTATTATAPTYRIYALPGGPPFKPALIHDEGGAAIEVDLWEIPASGLGRFLTMIPAPLALGTVTLADGASVTGFVAEPRATDGATDITAHGGWRAYLASLTSP
ncbi:MAG: allophanate hydrolase [Actinomycetota bacterium]